ncbi:MAG: metallothionein [Campylobacteraceae bacterium]|nr:metallothionein [Campylobacteraceae bacterium]
MAYKIILFVILIYLIYALFFGRKRNTRDKNPSEEELMVECAACKTFIGISEAIKKDGKYFCSQKCAKVKQ